MKTSPILAASAWLRRGLRRGFRHAFSRTKPDDLDTLLRRIEPGEGVWAAFHQAGVALARSGRYEEADRVLSRGLAAFPEDAALLVAYAMSAHHAGRYADAVERWRAALAAGSHDPMCYPGLSANLRTMGRLDEAQAAIDEALKRTPENLTAITEGARVAVARNNLECGLSLWEKALAGVPDPHPDWLQGHAQTLVGLGRYVEAEKSLTSSCSSFPDHRGLVGLQGMLASAREDWPTAIALWTEYRRTYPDDRTGWEQLGLAVQGSQLTIADDVPIVAAKIEVVEDEPLRHLMLAFESIGADCEFGLVQRRYGAEPLSLLRFNNVQIKNLLLALDAGLEGMGDPDLTTLIVSSSGEYYVTDVRWNLGMHTFMFAGQHEAKVLLPKMCRRVVFLKDKLIADLRAGEKTFVFKGNNIDLDDLRALHRRLRTYGPVRLLHIRQVGMDGFGFSSSARAKDVVEIEPDLLVGFLSRMGNAQAEWDIAFDEWIHICGTVLDKASRASEPSALPVDITH